MNRLFVLLAGLLLGCPVESVPDAGAGGGAATAGGRSTGGGAAVGGGSTAGGSTAGGSATAGGNATGGGATGGGSAGGATPGSLVLTPTGPVFTNGSVDVTVAVTGSVSGPVSLFIDGSTTSVHDFAIGGPYVTSLSFGITPEGSHTLVARALIGGLMVSSNTVDVTVDRTAPTLVAEWPVSSGMGPGVTPFWHEPWGFTFNEDMVAGAVTATAGAMPLFSGTPTSNNARTFTFRVTAPMPTPAPTVSIDLSAMRDRAGNALAAPMRSVSFSEASRLIGPRANPMANEFSLPGVAAGADGTTYVAFIERRNLGMSMGYDPAADRLVVRRIAPGVNQLLPALPIETAASGPVQVEIDALGRPIVAYDQLVGGVLYTVLVSRFENGAWVSLHDSLGTLDDLSYPKLALDPQGNLVLAGLHRSSSQLRVFRLTGTTWAALPAIAVEVPPPNQGSIGPGLAINPTDGRIAIAWASFNTGNINYRISLAISNGTAAFVPATPFTVDSTYSRPLGPSLEWSAAGLFLAFQDQHGVGTLANSSIHLAQVDLSAAPVVIRTLGRPLDVDFAARAIMPSLALDPGGRPVVAWSEDGVFGTRIHMATVDANGTNRLVAGIDFSRAGDPTATSSLTAIGRPYFGVVSVRSDVELVRFNGSSAYFGREVRESTKTCDFSAQPTLSATNCFILRPNEMPTAARDLLLYDLNAPLWSDGTLKRRWVQLPLGSTIDESDGGSFVWPAGTVMVKEFSIELTPGDRATRRPIETRFLVKPADGGLWEGSSYQWNPTFTDATLLSNATDLRVPWTLNGSAGTYTHIYPTRPGCNRCHNANAGGTLGPIAEQLDRTLDYGPFADHQLRTWNRLGLFGARSLSVATHTAHPNDVTEPLERRAKSYLQSNCSHCHRPGGEQPNRDYRFQTPLANARICATLPDGGMISPSVLPGNPNSSTMVLRMQARPGGMPPVATDLADTNGGLRAIRQWIGAMTTCP